MKQDITNSRLNVGAIVDAIEANENVDITVPERKLRYLLDAIDMLDVDLQPTNASTRDLIENTIASAAIGAGLGALASALRFIPGPIGWIALGSGLVGAGAGFFSTKYRIRIDFRGNQRGESTYKLTLKPAY